MTVSRSSATSDPMVLLCLIGGAVRGAGELNLLLQLMFIATCSPNLKRVLLLWMMTEERYAGLEFAEEPGVIEAGWGGPDGYVPARQTPRGRVALWRHVTRFGLAVMIPVVLDLPTRPAMPSVPTRCLGVVRLLGALSFFFVFSRDLALGQNCALNVTISL